jgi:protoheme IX farnesyltransferase
MMPNVRGEASTRRQMFIYTLILAPVGVAPWLLGFAGPVYGLVAAALGARFVWHGFRVLRMADPAMKPAKAMFAFSLFYLFALFAVLLAETAFARMLPGL